MSFWDFLKPPAPTKAKGSPKPPTAAELEAALAEAETEAARAETAAAEVAERRAQLLLTADDVTLDLVERELQLATRTADKSAMAVETLRTKLAAAQEAERQARLDAIFAEGQRALDAGLAAYTRYSSLAAEVAQLAETMADKCDEIEAANKKLRDAGDPRRIQDLDITARPEVSDIQTGRLALWHQVQLPSGEFPADWLWPHRPPQPRIRNQARPIPGPGSEPAPPPSRSYQP